MPTLLLLLLLSATATAAATSTTTSSSLVLTACSRARYPSLCIRSLSPSSPHSPADLARAAVSASLSSSRSASSSLHRLRPPSSSLPPPVRDCFSQLSDASDQLSRTLSELSRLRTDTFRWQLENACTWVSAALTNQDTCLDAVKAVRDAGLKKAVACQVAQLEKLTSNALYFVTRLAATRGRDLPAAP